MSTIDIGINAQFIAALGGGAKAAIKDLQKVQDAARQIGRDNASTRLGAELAQVSDQAQLARGQVLALDQQTRRLGTARVPARLGQELAQAGTRVDVAARRREAERLGTSGGGTGGGYARAPAGSGRDIGPGAADARGTADGRLLSWLDIAQIAKLAWDQSVAWDAAWAQVRTNVKDADENQFKALEKTIRSVSLELGTGRIEMAGLVAEAGAAGIAYADLEKFMRLTAKAAVGWEMAPRETSQKLAGIKAATGYTLDELAVVADKIKALADNSSIKESDVLDMFLQVGKAAKDAGVEADATLAILTAVRSGGMDRSDTARWFGALTGGLHAAETAPKRVKKGFELLGTSPRTVAEGMKTDSLGTMLDLFQRLEKSPKAAEAAALIFGRQWWNETMRVNGGIAGIIKQIQLLQDPKNYQGSLDKNFAIQAETTKFHLDQLTEVVSRIGEGFTSWTLEPFNRGVDTLLAKMKEMETSAGWWERNNQERIAYLEEIGVLKREEYGPPMPEQYGPPMPLSMTGDPIQRAGANFRQWLFGDQRGVDEIAWDFLFGRPGKRDEDLKSAAEAGKAAGQAENADYVRGLLDQRERLGTLPEPRNVPEHERHLVDRAKASVAGRIEGIDRKLMEALASPKMGPIARKLMEEYVAAIQAEGTDATAEAQRIAEQIMRILSITARPSIEVQPGPAGSGDGSPAPTFQPPPPTADLQSNVIHQHIYGGDAARLARLAQREQERAIRSARAGALHEGGFA